MENSYDNDAERNYNCLMKLYNFQDLMKRFKVKNQDSDNYYLIKPDSLLNYNEYCNYKELNSIFSKQKYKTKIKTKEIDKAKLPFIQEKDESDSFINEIKTDFKIMYNDRKMNIKCYNKIILINEDIKNSMTKVKNFASEKIIFTYDKIAIQLTEKILEIFTYDNVKRICKPRYIMIFEDQLQMNKELRELNKTEFINYINSKNINKRILKENLYNEKGKKIGKILNFNEILRQNKNENKERQKERIINYKNNYNKNNNYEEIDLLKEKIKQEQTTQKKLQYENNIKNETNESKNDSIILKPENIYNNNLNNHQINNFNNINDYINEKNISKTKSIIKTEEEKFGENSVKDEEDIKDSFSREWEELQKEEKKEKENKNKNNKIPKDNILDFNPQNNKEQENKNEKINNMEKEKNEKSKEEEKEKADESEIKKEEEKLEQTKNSKEKIIEEDVIINKKEEKETILQPNYIEENIEKNKEENYNFEERKEIKNELSNGLEEEIKMEEKMKKMKKMKNQMILKKKIKKMIILMRRKK